MASTASVYKNSSKREYVLTDEQRNEYRRISLDSRLAKSSAELGLSSSAHHINTPKLDPCSLMEQLEQNKLRCLSLFSGGGGLDLGFDRAGYEHVASYELIPICKETLKLNRPKWKVFGGVHEGDVTKIDWNIYQDAIDVIHGGPPCQPFSIAGEQKGIDDERNMWGEFIRAVNTIRPSAFVAENVLGILNPKFDSFVQIYILDKLQDYTITKFEMNAADYGVPQIRRRVFFVGFKKVNDFNKFNIPKATYNADHFLSQKKMPSLFDSELPRTLGVRAALGLPEIGFDNLAPTIRSAFTGKRNTTSILNSSAGQKSWGDMEIWPNGVQLDRVKASKFPAKNDHFRLSVQDVALLQGFPESWKFAGAVYQVLGQIGNSVAPPVAYQVAKHVAAALSPHSALSQPSMSPLMRVAG
ncbi:DNA (cytosine-5-)-methyltransferase [Pseudomonas sp. B21-056]|jgi:DNA (cytosine-5)-methyltransferase 1|uniref:DNA cytosine methyltransferase n=1 Tax=Pseudomonas sp. B21-056 TaxID=2895495 RepID=UPI0022322D1F|nr:DNA (cytosine-5-)-methyltransferase [Pseudomonas sp. B21-056]UZE23944.1 DNA (cytosine-5-)-methyltransferase [Pseudomonas sp. B21-056]